MIKINLVRDSLGSVSIIKKSISAEEDDRSDGSASGDVARQREPTAEVPPKRCQTRNSTDRGLRSLSLVNSYIMGHRTGYARSSL